MTLKRQCQRSDRPPDIRHQRSSGDGIGLDRDYGAQPWIPSRCWKQLLLRNDLRSDAGSMPVPSRPYHRSSSS